MSIGKDDTAPRARSRTNQAPDSSIVQLVTSEDLPVLPGGLAPDPARSAPVINPLGAGPGNWAGGPTAVADGHGVVLAYRLRRPVGEGRGCCVVIARSADGEHFETLQTITRDEMDAESLERPALVLTEDGTWRLYLSCATTGTKHWRVELMEAPAPDAFDPGRRSAVLPGDQTRAVKDPVFAWRGGKWHLWACVHPLTEPEDTDRMWTEYAVSADGLEWMWHGPALSPRPGEWDARGVRVTAVRFTPDGVMALYDGRASAAENFEERTGVAFGPSPDALTAFGSQPAAQSPHAGNGLRYVSVLELPDGRERLYYELTRADGAHELRTELR